MWASPSSTATLLIIPNRSKAFNYRFALYGCGNFLNDYEGISGEDAYRGDLALMCFVDLNTKSGALRALDMAPLAIRRLQLAGPSDADVDWLQATLDRASAPYGARVARAQSGRLVASWPGKERQTTAIHKE